MCHRWLLAAGCWLLATEMVCDVCKQNQATVHLTEIVDDQMSELHLCEGCANQKGAQMESHFGLSDLLAGLADFGKPGTGGATATEEVEVKTCENCGMTYDDFKKVGRLGCSECYAAFRKNLSTLLRRIHGSTNHVGKVPLSLVGTPTTKGRSELQDLKRRLQRAVEAEDFEEAAKIRDRLRELERQREKKS